MVESPKATQSSIYTPRYWLGTLTAAAVAFAMSVFASAIWRTQHRQFRDEVALGSFLFVMAVLQPR